MITSFLIQLLLAATTGGALVAAIQYFALRKKTRADTASVIQSANSDIIENLGTYTAGLEKRLNDQQVTIDKLSATSDSMKISVLQLNGKLWDAQIWINRCYTHLTEEQKAMVGPPPQLHAQP